MLITTTELLKKARQGGYAVGAFNVYNMEGVLAVVEAATESSSPVILQILPSALEIGGNVLISLCREAAKNAVIPVAVHLDHCSSKGVIFSALQAGCSSVMADGSHLPFWENIAFTRRIMSMAQACGAAVEAELGRITGEEDGRGFSGNEEKMTSAKEAAAFVEETGVDALAVCIGNVHGRYHDEPKLDFPRLNEISTIVDVPLVLHGTSGLSDGVIRESISNGICKFNVNTELRQRYLQQMCAACRRSRVELVEVMQECVDAMKEPVMEKIQLFGSNDKAE